MSTAGFKKYYQAPLPAIIAVAIVYFWQGMGHAIMYLMEHRWFPNNVFLAAFIIGVVGVVMVWVGRDKSENAATLLGFLGGSLIWLSWCEFSFVFVADELSVADIRWGAKDTKAEYRVMLSSIGVMFSTLMFFFFNRDTRCNAFMWLHRNLGLKPGEKASGQARNLASIVAMETIYVTWFFYIYLLVLYDPQLGGGDRSTAAYVSLGLYITWTAFLANRLLRFQRMAPAHQAGCQQRDAEKYFRDQRVVAEHEGFGTIRHLPDQISRHEDDAERSHRVAR